MHQAVRKLSASHSFGEAGSSPRNSPRTVLGPFREGFGVVPDHPLLRSRGEGGARDAARASSPRAPREECTTERHTAREVSAFKFFWAFGRDFENPYEIRI